MNARIDRLKKKSLEANPEVCFERALLVTEFYQRHGAEENLSPALLRAECFKYLCENKTVFLGPDELIVGERGRFPKATPTYPELTCHSEEDLRTLSDRPKTSYRVSEETFACYRDKIIPFWQERSLRRQIFAALPQDWKDAYGAGIFTEFMEQRAPGHTVADGKVFRMGMRDFKSRIADSRRRLEEGDPLCTRKAEQLKAMEVAADAVVVFARRHADLAVELAKGEQDPVRRAQLLKIADVCRHVPEQPPRDFHEALQMYWFCHLAVVTELNGWDAFSPGHLDQHLEPFYRRGIEDGTLRKEDAKELLCCLFIKFNNHPAPPKVGVTAAESGTYTDFANINLAGLKRDGSDGSNEVTFLLLEVIDELHLLQPSQNVQISEKTDEKLLLEACRVISKGYGFPSVFNADMVIREMLRVGKSIEDAREGGTSGCVETGAFGKESYILTGYLNLPKILELALNGGFDPRTKKQLGPKTGPLASMQKIDDVLRAWKQQLAHFLEIKINGNNIIEQLYAKQMPQPFLSLITDDCIDKALDYNEGGARYRTVYIQGVGIGTLTDSFAAIDEQVFRAKRFSLPKVVKALNENYLGYDRLCGFMRNRSPKWGCNDEAADLFMKRAFDLFFTAVDGRTTSTGARMGINMLPTTCHIYFGQVTGATPDGRLAGMPLSEGISPVQGRDTEGPTAILLSAAKMEHEKTGGTLLNMKFLPHVVQGEKGVRRLADLIRTYFKLGGHHIQFNVVDDATLRRAQQDPEAYRGLIVRVAGYSDYFTDLSKELQDEIILRTAQA